MNIRNLSHPITAIDNVTRAEGMRLVRTDASAKDRDGNGRRDPDERQPEARRLSDEEMQEALQYLAELPGVQDSSLTLHIEQQGDLKVLIVRDPNGQVVRRITELELSLLMQNRDKDQSKGHLFDKTG